MTPEEIADTSRIEEASGESVFVWSTS